MQLIILYSTRAKFHASQRSKKFYTNLYILFHPVGFLKRNTCVKFQVYSPYKSLASGLKAVRSLSVNHFCFELMYFQFPVKHIKSVKYIFITHSLLLVPWKNTSLYLFSVQPLDTPFVFLRDKRNQHCADTRYTPLKCPREYSTQSSYQFVYLHNKYETRKETLIKILLCQHLGDEFAKAIKI